MRKLSGHLTQARLKEVLVFDHDSGIFTRASDRGGYKAGTVAGTARDNGYIQVFVDHRAYRAHRLAFLYMTGEWPEHDVDHINGIRTDNRWVNLRPATRAENMENLRGPKSNNKSGLLGVCWSKRAQKWHAQIKTRGVYCHLGYFACKIEAHAAYLKAKATQHTRSTL